MHHFVMEMCTDVHISVTKWCIVGYGTGALWDSCNWFIDGSHNALYNRLWHHHQNAALAITPSHQENMHVLPMDTKIWMISLILMFAVRPICVQDSIFKMSSTSPAEHQQSFEDRHLFSVSFSGGARSPERSLPVPVRADEHDFPPAFMVHPTGTVPYEIRLEFSGTRHDCGAYHHYKGRQTRWWVWTHWLLGDLNEILHNFFFSN